MPPARVQLICMPYQNPSLSSLSIALLATVLRARGVDAVESYLHLQFATLVGANTYARIVDGRTSTGFIGELFFAEDYWGAIRSDPICALLDSTFGSRAERARLAETFRAYCLARVAQAGADLVGLTTSFNQLFPALWLARHIKERWPRVTTVLGGTGCAWPMGERIRQSYPQVDHVVSGAGEGPLLDLALGRPGAEPGPGAESPSVDLDELPIPDYEPFLREARRYTDDPARLMLAFETSRGCWWGEKHHCAFCGLNQQQIAFQAKSPRRAVDEIRTLWERHGIHLFATDSILAHAHLQQVLPALAHYDSKPVIFYEVKANLSEESVRVLKAAGVHWIQPGIESLSSRLLRLLSKGVTAIQNVALLKWCREQQVRVSWNILCGIPGEQAADYQAQIALIDAIPHFCPPQGAIPIRIDRFSPYFNHFENYGFREIRPFSEYRLLHPHMDEAALRDVAYHFEGVSDRLDVGAYLDDVQRSLACWQQRYARGDGLFLDPGVGLVRIHDREASLIRGDATVDAILDHSHQIVAVEALLDHTGCSPERIDEMVSWGLLYREGGRVINLAVRLDAARSR